MSSIPTLQGSTSPTSNTTPGSIHTTGYMNILGGHCFSCHQDYTGAYMNHLCSGYISSSQCVKCQPPGSTIVNSTVHCPVCHTDYSLSNHGFHICTGSSNTTCYSCFYKNLPPMTTAPVSNNYKYCPHCGHNL